MRAKIEASSGALSDAVASGDAVAAAAVYAEDALLVPPTGEAIKGRKAIESFWRSGLEIGVRSVELETLERGDARRLAYEVGRYRMRVAQQDDEPKLELGTYVVVHRQEASGSWRRVAEVLTAMTPSRTTAGSP